MRKKWMSTVLAVMLFLGLAVPAQAVSPPDSICPSPFFMLSAVSPSQTFMLMFREGIFTVPIWPSL